jgi:capsular exopolysaccharide synthesis family protein
MSHIFDALQRSESERTGFDFPGLAAATDLLQAAEREAALARGGNETQAAVAVPEVVPDAEVASLLQKVSAFPNAPQASPAEPAPSNAAVDQFSQFESLKVLVPPHSRLVCITEKDSLAAEKFRFLGVRLRQLQQSRPLKKILITSTIPQEGKSMMAANLACTLARRQQQKTLLIDGDLRRPSLATAFGLGKIRGISEWLHGECGPMTSIYHLEGTGLWILPAGHPPANPLELMQSGRLSVLMDQLTNWFDWIVIDSPPVLPLADTSVWMRLADGVLLVARQGTTEKKQLQRGLEAIEAKKLLGALLNCSETSANSDYYYRYAPAAASQPAARPDK